MIMNLASQNAAESVNRIVNGVSKNILIPTLGTITKNGITCTNNGDGTYTLNGTASANTDFTLLNIGKNEISNGTYRIIGCPNGGSATSYTLFLQDTTNWNGGFDRGNGGNIVLDNTNYVYECWIKIYSGYTCNNLVFKPMLTTDLTVTYDDFEPQYKSVSKLTTDIEDLKYLGWTVPKEMPIQNYISDDGVFHQRVGRVDLGSLEWSYGATYKYFSANISGIKTRDYFTSGVNLICAKYEAINGVSYTEIPNKRMKMDKGNESFMVADYDYTNATAFKTAMQGIYLYYELANEITITRQKIDYIDASADVIFGDVPESEFNRLRTSCEKIGNLVIFSVTTRETVTTSPDSYLFILPFKPIKQNLINDYYLLDTDGKLRYTVFGGTTINLLEFRFSYFTND